MFTDWSEALEAESLPLDPTTEQQLAAAARVTAHHSHDKHDLTLLLDALGLLTDLDTLTALLPLILIPETGDTPVTTTPAPAPALETTEPIDVPVIPLPGAHPVQELLDWATAHPAAAVRITADLAELTERRGTEAAEREAEQKVAKARAELERAQGELRSVKAGTRTTAAAPTGARTGASGRSREELAAIRSWARANGRQVADQGMVPKRIQEAYDAAHQIPVRENG
ncbi:histone-like nucleoid-structuring protein Lsr2 [Streptomyces griseus]|uniref:Lsr2 family DNA-binding protein n=1 Tax=Streptomyces griseus TaxID=1911 RepID=UPI0037D54825